MKFYKFYLAFFTLIVFITSVNAQDTLSLSLVQADSVFLKNNLLLLAQQYNINAKQALVIQARAYPNPTFSADFNVIDPQNNKLLHIDNTGQKSFQIEQLILLGGKRKVEIEIAKQDIKVAEAEFAELLRNLKLQLQTSFFNLIQQNRVLINFENQLHIIDTIIKAYDVQVKNGNVPLKDLIRLKSVYIKINNEKSAVAADRIEELKNISLILQSAKYIKPVIGKGAFEQYTSLKSLSEILDLANKNRPDLRITETETGIALLNYKLQKKQAIPDMSINASYDQRGGAFINQVNSGIALGLPAWNRNKGGIRAAEAYSKSAELLLQQKKLEIEIDCKGAWQNMTRSISEFNKLKKLNINDFEIVFNGVNDNFQKNNISILEFVDFFEAYNESISEFERVKKQLALAAAQINYVTAYPVY